MAGALWLTLAASINAHAAPAPISGSTDLGVAVSAQIACGSIFVSGRSVSDVLRDDVQVLAEFTKNVTLSVDRDQKTVTASAPDAVSRTALYRPSVGCTLMTGNKTIASLQAQASRVQAMRPKFSTAWPDGDKIPRKPHNNGVGTVDHAALENALEAAFAEQNGDGYPDTRAIVVVQDGKILAERYAPGFDRRTPLLGWSATKSIMATLIGILVDDGVLDLDAPAPVPEWQAKDDPRSKITLRHLLTMTSGLNFSEDYVPGSDSIKMLFEAGDMSAMASTSPLKKDPGTSWSYSSGTTNILSGIVFRSTGATLENMTQFAQKRLFQPLGMTSALIAPDESGVLVGSSYGYATARDWARFGMLYLNGGRAGKRQLLSRNWVNFALAPTTAAPRPVYGAHIWLNAAETSGESRRMLKDLPSDMFMAMGHNYQIVAAIPSHNAVIVRLGWTPEGKSYDFNKHLAHIIAALAKGSGPSNL